MISNYRDIILGLACVGHVCWGALGLLFVVVSMWFGRQPPMPPMRRE